MDFEYDSYNRIQRMTYPDGEVVSYEYNKGGLLKWVSGLKNDIPYSYINDIRYNKFELKESVEYGNGTVMTYDYDQLQRLKHLESNTAQQETMQEIEYEYDGVGNITKITNSAGALANGLGGTYNNEYTYDNLYRLSTADGDWQGMEFLDYNLKMSYYKNGRVEHKKLMANTMTAAGHTDINYQRRYFYDNSSQPNTLTRIEEQEWMSPNGNSGGSGGGHVIGIAPVTPYTPPVTYEHEFEWDASGNMTYHHHEGENSSYERYLCWDEVNHLQGVVDDTHQTFYQYDANGERTYKLTTREQAQMVNGHWYYYTVMDNPTLYVSPYLVVTRQGYTKHYYAENERIASKIGMGGLTDICQCLCPDMTLQSGNQGGDPMNQQPYEPADLTDCEEPEECFYDKLSLNNNHFERVMRECLESNPNVEPNTLNEALYSFRENMEEYEPDCYWYHPDHLGSSSWITYTDGSAVQHLHYLPWGEDFVDQRTTNWAALHTFSAKEKDTETGLSYFGARYYSSDLSIWLSVDPMSDKYPSLSPYVYCANNPIKLVDPNGEEIVLETIYKKDDNGNNTGEIDRYNIRITGKIINSSGKKLDMENVKNDIVNQIESSFSGKTKEGITVTTTADFEVVDSYNDIDNTKDHIIELKDNVTLNKNDVLGKVDKIGGSKAEIRASLFTGVYDKKTHQGGKTAAHEMGHLLGLEHRSADGFFNLMRSPRFGTEVSTKQITKIVNLLKARSYFNTVR